MKPKPKLNATNSKLSAKRKGRRRKPRKNSTNPERSEFEDMQKKLKLKYQKAANARLPVSDQNVKGASGYLKNSGKYLSTLVRVESGLARKKQVTYVEPQLIDFLRPWGSQPQTDNDNVVKMERQKSPESNPPPTSVRGGGRRAKKRKAPPTPLAARLDVEPTSDQSQHMSAVVCIICKQGDSTAECFGPYEFASKSVDPLYQPKTKLKSVVDGEAQPRSPKLDVYVHEECALWSYRVGLEGVTLVGLEEELEESQEMVCTVCSQPNAHLMCLAHGCPNTYHLPCAVQANCGLRDQRFGVICPGCSEAAC